VAVVAALLHAKVYGDVPPVPFALAVPLLPPLQLTDVFEALAANSTGSVMVTLDVLVQELASDTVTVYVPADNPVILAVVAELLHAKVYGEVPPEAVSDIDPSESPLHSNAVEEAFELPTKIYSFRVV
jgi:hypothetical protein